MNRDISIAKSNNNESSSPSKLSSENTLLRTSQFNISDLGIRQPFKSRSSFLYLFFLRSLPSSSTNFERVAIPTDATVKYFKCHDTSFIFKGKIEKSGCLELLKNFKNDLSYTKKVFLGKDNLPYNSLS